MMDASNALPNEIDALRALILAERAAHAVIIAERDKLAIRNERLEAIIAEIRRAHFGRKSERGAAAPIFGSALEARSEQFGVEPIRLCPTVFARDRNAGRMNYVGFDITRL
jgi:hypothetical protein